MKEEIRETVLRLGADVCGIANIQRFTGAPEGFSPSDLFEECKSVIVFGIALPQGLLKVKSTMVYGHFNYGICPEIDLIALHAAKIIEVNFGGTAVPLPSDIPYDYWDADKMEGRGLLSMKHAAVAAGLGALGKNTLLLNESYGNLLTLGAILTDLDLQSDPLADLVCIPGCTLCLSSCPVQALDGTSANQKRCRAITYGTNARGLSITKCNTCRKVCPLNKCD